MPAVKSAAAGALSDSNLDLAAARVHGDGRPSGLRSRRRGRHRFGDRVRQDRRRPGRASGRDRVPIRSAAASRSFWSGSPRCSPSSIFVINVALSRPLHRRAAVLPGDRHRDHPAAAPRHRQRQPVDGFAAAAPNARCSSSGWSRSRTSATSRCSSPTRPAPSPKGRSPSTSALDPDGQPSTGAAAARAGLQRGDHDRQRAGRRQRPGRRAVVSAAATWHAPAVAGATSASAPCPFDHERQLASVLVRDARRRARPRDQGRPRGGARPVHRRRRATRDAHPRAALRRRRPGRGSRRAATRPDLATLTAADEHDLRLAGFLTFVDRPKADAGASIAKLNALGIDGQDHHRRQRHGRGQGLPRHRPRRRTES